MYSYLQDGVELELTCLRSLSGDHHRLCRLRRVQDVVLRAATPQRPLELPINPPGHGVCVGGPATLSQ